MRLYSNIRKEIFVLNDSVQFSSVTQSCLTLCDPMACSTPGLPVHHQLPEFTQTHALCCPLLLPSSIFPSISVFSNESALCIRWPNIGVISIGFISVGAQVFSNIEVGKTKIKIEKEGFRLCKFFLNISNEKHSY